MTLMKDECALCSRVLSLYSLRRCLRCRKLYCRSCMTTNLWSEERDLICLDCARKIVAPRLVRSKYGPIRAYLSKKGKYTNWTTLTFSEIEGIINDNLPFSALRTELWWNNNVTTPQGYAWTSAGWKAQKVDLKKRTVAFQKTTIEKAVQKLRRKRRRAGRKSKPFTPVPVKPRGLRKPSKTHVAKVIARAKNLERKRATRPAGIALRSKLKPKSAYEKRLYKPGKRPSRND